MTAATDHSSSRLQRIDASTNTEGKNEMERKGKEEKQKTMMWSIDWGACETKRLGHDEMTNGFIHMYMYKNK